MNLRIIDTVQRKINSILFRFVIISYSIYILAICNNCFKYIIYIPVLLLYIFIYFKLQNLSKLRIINDFLFICIIVYGKNPFAIINYTFIILPIINTINFSGDKQSGLVYIYTILSFYIKLVITNSKK